ncbi:hypothetical protein P9597_03015 [Aneurinibacillus migulanus]|uniref:hypothetical protein n=1 Tax=Aneurinibacillus migulanus TaxID=47500 RepID=UPI002E1AB77B|nr:hypothetical protein [Aneurinibacillus migulanus]
MSIAQFCVLTEKGEKVGVMVKFLSWTFIIFMLALFLIWGILTITNGAPEIVGPVIITGIIFAIGMLAYIIKLLKEIIKNSR